MKFLQLENKKKNMIIHHKLFLKIHIIIREVFHNKKSMFFTLKYDSSIRTKLHSSSSDLSSHWGLPSHLNSRELIICVPKNI